MQKVVNYHTNGSGRDTYISTSNGGFYKPTNITTEDSFIASPARNSSMPSLSSKFKLYHQDGSGRDAYIFENQGGFYASSVKQGFVQNLRHHSRMEGDIKDNDFLRRSQQFFHHPKEQQRQRRLSLLINDVTGRLKLPQLKKQKLNNLARF